MICIIFVVINQRFYTMRILIVYLTLVVGILMIALGSSGGRARVAKQGNTGAPGDNRAICKNCHAGSAIVVDMDIWLLDENGNRVYSYMPEQEYTVQVRIEPKKGNPRAFGFQMVCLDAPPGKNGSDIKNWLPDTNNIYQIADANNGRTYVEHRQPIRNDGIINVRWKAPPAGTDTVTFYAAGNGVNLNGNTQGDGADTTRLAVPEATSTATKTTPTPKTAIAFYPNPFNHYLKILLRNNGQKHDFTPTIAIYGPNSQLMYLAELSSNTDIPTFSWPSGTYTAIVTSTPEAQPQVHRLVKL